MLSCRRGWEATRTSLERCTKGCCRLKLAKWQLLWKSSSPRPVLRRERLLWRRLKWLDGWTTHTLSNCMELSLKENQLVHCGRTISYLHWYGNFILMCSTVVKHFSAAKDFSVDFTSPLQLMLVSEYLPGGDLRTHLTKTDARYWSI